MFQLTPAYPAWLARGLPVLLLLGLLAWSAQLAGLGENLRMGILLFGLAVGSAFAAGTLYLQSRRRRKVSDTTLLFFRTAMLCLLAIFLSALLFTVRPDFWNDPRTAVWIGLLALVGVFVTAIQGMLYKIMPFLNWLHLQRLCGLNMLPPTMNQMIPERAMRRQYYMHLLGLALLLLAVWQPVLARPAGLVFAIDCVWLGINLLQAVRVYRRFKAELEHKAAAAA
jgi:hypothetical protein